VSERRYAFASLPLGEQVEEAKRLLAEHLSRFRSATASVVPGKLLRKHAEERGLPLPAPFDTYRFSVLVARARELEEVVDERGKRWRRLAVEEKNRRYHYARRVFYAVEEGGFTE